MDHAWLDSLSEDWISQPRSSASPAPSFPSLPSLSNSTTSNPGAKSSRIPKFDPQKQVWAAPQDSSNSPLSERSLNEHNIPMSQSGLRQPSKLRDDISQEFRGRKLSRTLSASTTHSVQYNTVNHKSVSLSPKKGTGETPEWRRRLLHGQVAYGEQCDLFSPAGLETLFQPPQPQSGHSAVPQNQYILDESAVPSSPPPYLGKNSSGPLPQSKREVGQLESGPRQNQKAVKYNMVDLNEVGSAMDNSFANETSDFANPPPKPQLDIGNSSGSTYSNTQTAKAEDKRAVSGQSDIRNEEFSPVYVARHNTVEDKQDAAALSLPPQELHTRLEQVQQDLSVDMNHRQGNTSLSLLDGEGDQEQRSQFVNTRRGGYSEEGSFQERMLSPSSLPIIGDSSIIPNDSIFASTPKHFPRITKTRLTSDTTSKPDAQPTTKVPQTAPASPVKSTEKNNGGSPLKLFGNYDTFTNQKLLRRLSQFEGDYDGKKSDTRPLTQDSIKSGPKDPFVGTANSHQMSFEQAGKTKPPRNFTSFGQGDLDTFQFSEEVSYNSPLSGSEDGDRDNMSLPPLDPSRQTQFKFHLDPSSTQTDQSVKSRNVRRYSVNTSTTKRTFSSHQKSRPTTGTSLSSNDPPVSSIIENLLTPRKRNGNSEGKRLQRSPLKDPTPKRRRTFQQSEIAERVAGQETKISDGVNETHQQMQSVLGRKRKTARHGEDQQAANPKVLAMRQILRPRTPIPSQRSSMIQHRTASQEVDPDSSEYAQILQARKIAMIQEELDRPESTQGSNPLKSHPQMQSESRKGSVTTQDFIDEARKIMAGIRGKVRSGLTSVEESESDNDHMKSPGSKTPDADFEDSYQESTREPFSRPPSREGKPVERVPHTQDDPALLDHLRKYQETSDLDMVIASSVKSIAVAKEVASMAKELDRIADETISRSSAPFKVSTEGSDPPNIRISENPDLQRKRKHSTSSVIPESGAENDDQPTEYPSHGSNASSSQSTTRSIPTGSSRGSDSRRVIAPHTVSHLIPKQLAGMVFDRDRNIWVKGKSIDLQDQGDNFLPSDDDDPFGDIPDLSVDETQELRRLKAVAAKKTEEALVAQLQYEQGAENLHKAFTTEEVKDEKEFDTATEAKTRESPSKSSTCVCVEALIGSESFIAEPSQQPLAKLPPRKQSSFIKIDHESHVNESKIHEAVQAGLEVDVEKEISILEDRVDSGSPQRRRNVTITFSSPLAQVMQSPDDEEASIIDDVLNVGKARGSRNSDSNQSPSSRKGSVRKGSSMKIRSALRNPSRRMSVGGHTFSARPVSRIDEHDEESFNQKDAGSHHRSISIKASTPSQSEAETSVILATPYEPDQIGNFSLTPLSDFTIHQADKSFGLNVSYVESGQRFVLGAQAKRTLSLSIRDLVEKITQVEPYEPFWEYLTQLELRDKRLTTLHKLDEFCEHLEELDACHNQITHLDGVPASVRDLRITHNHLSDLAAWGHLRNLQYIDISDNQVESLSGFKSLVHLRGLRADNNKIRSLEGIAQLDALLHLRLRGNSIETLDFAGSKLGRLTDLDLKNNNIYEIRNLRALQSLSVLNLEQNNLVEFATDGNSSLKGLKYLRLSDNHLEQLDVSQYLDLRVLYVDRNRLERVSGLLKTKYLDSLSMREQQEGVFIDTSFLAEALEVRKLFLSGNLLTNFQPTVEYLNLQYLELANCGIETLSPEFGYMVSNTRILNLNFNALRDIRPLSGIARLKKVHLAGNRLARLRTTGSTLSEFNSTLSFADLRNNPLTQGFYPPLSETRMIIPQNVNEEDTVVQPFILRDADRIEDSKYLNRLDQPTKLLRRAFEMLILGGCLRLKTLDGLAVDRSVLTTRDVVWKGLVSAGILRVEPATPPLKEKRKGTDVRRTDSAKEKVKKSSQPASKEKEKEKEKENDPFANKPRSDSIVVEQVVENTILAQDVTERWQAEDSFA